MSNSEHDFVQVNPEDIDESYNSSYRSNLTLRRWRIWIRPVVIIIYILIFLGFVPFFAWYLDTRATPQEQAWLIALVFMVFTIPISLWTILHHLIYYTQPELQKHIIRILWMVPIYSIDSWVAIFEPKVTIFFDTIREGYEAYVIYNFMIYLLNYLSREYEIASTLGSKPTQKHLFPFCCFKPWPMGGIFIANCKHGVLQYTVIRLITTCVAFICQFTGTYNEGSFDVKSAWLWIVIINNISQVWAIYCLFLFYQATKEELKPIKPKGKFICVKLVIFASFWQAVAIAVLIYFIPFKTKWGWTTKEQMANGLQDFLICIEMLLAAIAHHFVFDYKPFIETDHNVPWYRSIRSMLDVSDVRADVSHHVREVGHTVIETSRKLRFRNGQNKPPQNAGEKTGLLAQSDSELDDYGASSSHQTIQEDSQSEEIHSEPNPHSYPEIK